MDFALVAFDGVDRAVEVFATARERPTTSRWQDQVGLVEHHEDGHLVLRGTFAGHYVDVDEGAHVSEAGAAKGLRIGALIGFLLGPPAFAVGSVLGTVVGSQEAEPDEREREPTLLVDKLRGAVPAPGSGIVLIADADDVHEMLGACARADAHVTKRTLSEEDRAVLDISLGQAPPASTGSQEARRP